MNIKNVARIFGVGFVIVGILGFIPGIVTAPHAGDPNLAVHGAYGRLFGLFPVNLLHNLVHILLGIWGLAASKEMLATRRFFRGTAVIYGVLVVFGLIPVLNTFFGLVPIFGHDIWLHAILSAASFYFGWAPVTSVGNVQPQT